MCAFQVDHDACRLCLKCVQMCPVYAVQLVNGKIVMDSERCVSCGDCMRGCGHGAITGHNQLDQLEAFIHNGRKVILTLDPACRAFLPEGAALEQLAAAVQTFGIWETVEASEAVAAVASEYARLLREKGMEHLILSFCPVIHSLVEQYYPELLPYLAPVASPMIASGRMLKRDFTSAAVVYVTPCNAKEGEIRDVRHSTEINAVLTIRQLLEAIHERDIDISACSPEPLLSDDSGFGMLGACSGGMLGGIRYFFPEHDYHEVSVSGMARCMSVLEELKQGRLRHCILELSACEGGCIGGPGGIGEPALTALRLDAQAKAGKEMEPYFDIRGIALSNPGIARPKGPYVPTDAQIQEMLYQIGVGNIRQQQNCGACGYKTCRQRAEAILGHQENVSLCRQVVQEARRDVYSEVYHNLPMAALLVDESQRVVGLNREARSLFSLRPEQEKYIFELMDPGDFQYVLDTGLPITNRRMDIPEIFMRVEASLVPLKELHMVLGLFRDITEDEQQEAVRRQSRLGSVEMAQKIIEKQMTVAQQIAFLLGETTAETKVTLNQIKHRILEEEDAQ